MEAEPGWYVFIIPLCQVSKVLNSFQNHLHGHPPPLPMTTITSVQCTLQSSIRSTLPCTRYIVSLSSPGWDSATVTAELLTLSYNISTVVPELSLRHGIYIVPTMSRSSSSLQDVWQCHRYSGNYRRGLRPVRVYPLAEDPLLLYSTDTLAGL